MDAFSKTPDSERDGAGQQGSVRIPSRLCIGWGLGAVTMGVMANVFNVLILRFATEILGIAAGLAGAVLAVSKLYDAFFDPIVGTISDNLQTSWGRRRPVLAVATLLCPLSILFLFFAPDLSDRWSAWYYCVAAILLSTAYAAWTVPYLAMSVEMTGDYHERSRLVSYRVYGGALGLVVGSLCGASVLSYFGGGRAAYHAMALVTSVAIVAISLLFLRMTRSARFSKRTEVQRFSISRQAKLIFASKPLFILIATKGWWYLNVAASQASLVYVIEYIDRKPVSWLTYYFFALTAGMMGAQKLWLIVSRRFDKRPAMIAANALYAFAVLSWLHGSENESLTVFLLRAAFIGASSGGVLMLLLSMFNDAVDADFLVSGVRREGAFAGIYALVEKLFTALGVAATGALLGAMGYIPSKTGMTAQPDSALLAMLIAVSVIPAVGALCCIGTLSFYQLDRAGRSFSN